MNNSRVSSDNYKAMSELAAKTGEPLSITDNGKAREQMLHHRDAVNTAELSRLSGEPVYSQFAVDARRGAFRLRRELRQSISRPCWMTSRRCQNLYQQIWPDIGAEGLLGYAPTLGLLADFPLISQT